MRGIVRPVFLAVSILTAAGCSAHIGQVERAPNGRVVERILNDLGGHVRTEHALWTARQRRHGINHYVIDGNCASFCSFVALASPDSCYTPSVRLGVHPASFGGLVETDATREFTRSLVALWPKGLQDWWARNRPSVLGRDLLYHDLKEIIPERECGPDLIARR